MAEVIETPEEAPVVESDPTEEPSGSPLLDVGDDPPGMDSAEPEPATTDPGIKLRRKLKAELLRHYMQDSEAIQHLISLDISDDSLAALSLIPLVEVAWADGTIDKKEKDAIVSAARKLTPTHDAATCELLEHWLTHKPDRAVLDAWDEYVAVYTASLGAIARDAFKQELLYWARTIAESAGGILGHGNKTSKLEQLVIEELGQAMPMATDRSCRKTTPRTR